MVVFLKDIETAEVDVTIVTETSTGEDIIRVVDKVKFNHPHDWTLDDIIEALPKDCKAYSRFDTGVGTVYY